MTRRRVVPLVIRTRIEQSVALGRTDSEIVAVLSANPEDVQRVRHFMDEVAFTGRFLPRGCVYRPLSDSDGSGASCTPVNGGHQ